MLPNRSEGCDIADEGKQTTRLEIDQATSQRLVAPKRSMDDTEEQKDLLWRYEAHRIEPTALDTGLLTSGFLLAIKNRILLHKLMPDNVFDLRRYPAAFVHDIAMLPGTLAHLLEKKSDADLMDRLMPAILPCYRTVVDPQTKEPRLVCTGDPTDHARGIVIFGQGKSQRVLIHEHYRHDAVRRAKGSVIVDTKVPVPRTSREAGDTSQWTTQRTVIKADVWFWIGHGDSDLSDAKPWRFDEYLSGAYFEKP